MFINAFTATSTFTGLSPGSGSGNMTGIGLSVDNAIPKYVGTTGNTLESSGITISDNNDLEMYSVLENAIILRRWGSVGTKTDPTFAFGRIVTNGNGEAVQRTIYSGFGEGERTLSEVGSDGSLTLYAESAGIPHILVSENTRVFPFATMETSTATGWYYHPAGADQDAQVFSGLEGIETYVIKTGPDKANLVSRAEVSESSLLLTDSVAFDMTEFPAHPAPPSTGEVRVYPHGNGAIYMQDDTGAITPLSPQPVVTHEANYRGNKTNGYLKNGDTYSNKARFQVPFDSDILSISVDCSAATNEWRVEILVDANPVPAYTLTLLATETEKNVELPGVILNKNSNYGIRIQKGVAGSGAGPNIPDPAVALYLRKRA